MLAAILLVGLGVAVYALTRGASRPAVPGPQVVAVPPPQAPAQPPESPKPAPGSLAAPAAPLPLPPYPVGLKAKFQGYWITFRKAWQDGQGGWHYEVDIATWAVQVATNKAVSAQFIRDTIANQMKQHLAPDQAFPSGIEVWYGRKGGMIESVFRNSDGLWVYRLKGWPNAVTQGQLLDELVKA